MTFLQKCSNLHGICGMCWIQRKINFKFFRFLFLEKSEKIGKKHFLVIFAYQFSMNFSRLFEKWKSKNWFFILFSILRIFHKNGIKIEAIGGRGICISLVGTGPSYGCTICCRCPCVQEWFGGSSVSHGCVIYACHGVIWCVMV